MQIDGPSYCRTSALIILYTAPKRRVQKIEPPGRWTNAHPPSPPFARWYLGGFSQHRPRAVVTTSLLRQHTSVGPIAPTRAWSPTSARPSPTAFTTASTTRTRRTSLLLAVGLSGGRSAALIFLATERDSPRLRRPQHGSRYVHMFAH